MLKNRIVVTLLTDGKGNCVKPISFDHNYIRPVGSLIEQVRVFAGRDIDELVIIDMLATKERREPNFKLLRDVCDIVYAPITFGGGVSKIPHIREALNNGADKVIIRNSLNSVGFLNSASRYIGSQSLVGAVDVSNTDQGQQDFRLVNYYCLLLQTYGIGEIFLTDKFYDGRMQGYNLNLIKAVCKDPQITVPVVANGGAGTIQHMSQALAAGANAVAASSIYLYEDITTRDVAKELYKTGHKVRV